MINIIALIIYLGVAFLMYRTILKPLEGPSLSKKDYLVTLLLGAVPCTLCIIIFEQSFDRFILKDPETLMGAVFVDFFRAALIEELCKMVFARHALKKHNPSEKTEWMLLAGMIGLGYGLVEKLAMGGGAILIMNAFLPLHIFFQFLMGARFFDAKEAGDSGNAALAKKKRLEAFFLPFLVHGAWDSLLDTAGWLMDRPEGSAAVYVGLAMFIGLFVFGIIIEIKVIKKIKRM